ncbi:hypothetical protein PV08_09935 [Exophiala spinifera]|uniref:Uncharacterized protein n=1 Tax=Exophiala spinifera TaxID=91928 RepID=A0A0D1ZIG6_9EURO|nr:uncharacterized protein PV08_09935 [Exophiala spinifera]KIW12657.1 hypothetical protein PV08_09935 [Exophiala spinifera]
MLVAPGSRSVMDKGSSNSEGFRPWLYKAMRLRADNDLRSQTYLQQMPKSFADIGPAKGYIEALETRLKETERLLWRMLSAASANVEILAESFNAELDHRIPASLCVSTLSTTDEKKSAIAYWEQYPLQTPEDVILWKQDLDSQSGMAALGSRNVVDNSLFERLEVASPSDPSPFEGSFPSADPSPVQDIAHEAGEDVASQGGVPFTPEPRSFHPSAPSQTSQNVGDALRQPSTRSHRSSTAAKFGLSQEFEDTFLW